MFARETLLLCCLWQHAWPDPVVQVVRNIQYSTIDPRLVVDIYFRPMKHSRAPRPVLLYVHGGAWVQGSKLYTPPLVTYLAARGFVCASAQYRLLDKDEHAFPDNLVDLKRCVVWLRANVAQFHGSPEFIVSSGSRSVDVFFFFSFPLKKNYYHYCSDSSSICFFSCLVFYILNILQNSALADISLHCWH